MLNPIEIKFKLDKTIKRALTTELMIKSHDINVIEFHISFDGLELTADHTVKVLSVFNDTKSQTNVTCDIVGGKAIYRPDTSLISQYEHAQNYVYVYHGDQSLDVRSFTYSMDLSQIDKTALKVKEVYDQSYADLLADFEQALQDYKDSLPQASDLRAEVDVILNKFKTDSDAKLSQYDADAQQAIADNQTAFGLAESGRQSSYEQAEDNRNQASEQAVVDWEQGADALVDSKLIEMQTDASTLINGAIDDFNLRGDAEIADWREGAEIELAVKLQNFKLKNEVVNGDFSNGVTGWQCFYGNLTAINNELEVTVTSFQTSASYIGWRSGIPIIGGRKYYSSMIIKPKHIKFTRFQIGGGITAPFNPPTDVYTRVSDVVTALSTVNNVTSVRFYHYTDTLYTIGDKINFKNFMLIDLTNIFGAGNEPTKLEMDELVKVIPNGWWNGELSLTQKQVLNWQLKLMRQNRNALIALGGTII